MASPNNPTNRLSSLHTASHTSVTPSSTVTLSTAQTSSVDILQSLSLVSPTPEHSLLPAHPDGSINRVTVYSTETTSESFVISKSSSSFDLDTQSTIIPYKTLLISEDRVETRTHVGNKGSAIISTALPNATFSRKYPLNWSFISGLIIGAILLVLIAIVSILLLLVVCVRRREDSPDDYTTNKPSNLFTATHTDIDQGESSFPMLGKLHNTACLCMYLVYIAIHMQIKAHQAKKFKFQHC